MVTRVNDYIIHMGKLFYIRVDIPNKYNQSLLHIPTHELVLELCKYLTKNTCTIQDTLMRTIDSLLVELKKNFAYQIRWKIIYHTT